MSSALAAASLILKPEGYSEGRLQTLKPIEKLGSELVTNGDFVNGSSNWSTYTSGSSNVVFSDDVATINIDGSNSNVGIYQENVFSSGVQYRIVLRAKGSSSFDAEVLESQGANLQQAISSFSLTTSYQDFVFTHTANGTNDIFIHRLFSASGANESIIIDNVSIKEVLVDGGDFTFTRGSNLSATRINSAGLIEKGRENLLLQSNQFDTTWLTANTSLTGGQSGYDGNDAWLLDIVSGTNSQRIEQSISQSGVQTYSVYVKKGTLNWVRIRVNATVTAQSYFDLENGVVGTIQAGLISRSIESVGNGWFRCSIVFNSTSSLVRIYPANDDGSVTQSSGSIYIQDAQLEAGMAATDYIETGASTVKAGILENTPRLDYSGGATEPSLLLEPQRTNEIGYSEYFGGWTNTNLSIDSNFYNSPEGIANANFVIPTTTSGLHKLRVDLSSVTGSYTQSIYAKQGGYKNLLVWDDSTSGGIGVNLDDLSIFRNENNSGYNVQDVGNGWVRISVTQNYSSQIMRPSLYIYDNSATPAISYAGDGTNGIYIYGAQLEQGSYPTSYIPTYGSSETRSKDSCEEDGFISNGITTSSNFTFYAELEGLGQNGNPQVYLEDVSENRILSLNLVGQKNRYGFYSPDASNYVSTTSHEADGVVKIAVTYDGTNFKEYFNGVEKGTLAASVTVNMDRINFNKLSSNSIAVYKAILFPTALSNADCITLTTL